MSIIKNIVVVVLVISFVSAVKSVVRMAELSHQAKQEMALIKEALDSSDPEQSLVTLEKRAIQRTAGKDVRLSASARRKLVETFLPVIRKELPMQADEYTIWVGIDGDANGMSYYYKSTVELAEIWELAVSIIKPDLINAYCTMEAVRFLRDNDMTSTYIYTDPVGDVFSILVTNDDCWSIERMKTPV